MSAREWTQIERETGIAIRDTAFLGEGWDFIAYRVNGEFVFRFPKRAECWADLHRETAFLAFAADRLPLAVPRYVHVIRESAAAPNGYAVYRYLPGEPLNLSARGPAERDDAAQEIAAFLRALHTLRLEPDLASLLPREDPRATAEEYRRLAERTVIPTLSRSAGAALQAFFDAYLEAPGHFAFDPVVRHADFSREHLLADGRRVTAVIDFGDVSWGDADYDFLYLGVDFGERFALDVARRYGHTDLDRIAHKLRYFAVVDQIDTIVHGGNRALAGQVDTAWQHLKRLLAERHES